MTLSTNIYVLDPADHRELFTACQAILGQLDEQQRGPDQQRWEDEQDSWPRGENRAWTIQNVIGQGLPAWLMVHYRPDAPLWTAEQAAAHDEDCDEECAGRWHAQPCWFDIDIDTAYSYKGPGGARCGDLHAAFITLLAARLAERGLRFRWRNEYSGDVYDGLNSLDTLRSDTRDAMAWFDNMVMPAIGTLIADRLTSTEVTP